MRSLGRHGIPKQIFLGAREADVDVDYLKAFVAYARQPAPAPPRAGARKRAS